MTPACAGRTRRPDHGVDQAGDDPRLRGENVKQASNDLYGVG